MKAHLLGSQRRRIALPNARSELKSTGRHRSIPMENETGTKPCKPDDNRTVNTSITRKGINSNEERDKDFLSYKNTVSVIRETQLRCERRRRYISTRCA